MTIDFESFNFDNLAGDNPFGEQKTSSYNDERFYKLTRDKDDNGMAVIRFLPDPDKKLMQQLFKINCNTVKNGVKRWFSDWSPQNVGRKDPFQEHWAKLWNAGDKEEARKFARSERYVVNILVVKDPAAPENEGKIFLLEMSKTLKARVADFMMPSSQDIALGKKPAELFNPLNGQNFIIRSKRGANGFINYDSSEPMAEKTAVFDSKEEAIEAIKNRCYRLSEFLDEANYPSNEFLQEKLDHVLFKDTDTGNQNAPKQEKADTKAEVVDTSSNSTATTTNQSTDNLDDYLDSIM